MCYPIEQTQLSTMGNPDGGLPVLYACSVKMWASQSVFSTWKYLYLEERKSTGTVIVMDKTKTIYSDLEALLIFMPVKWVVNSAECFYKRRVFGMTLVITGLLI